MKDVKMKITLGGEEFPMVFNMNVMEEIQEKYGSLTEWGRVTEANADGVDVKAVKFGLCAMINEGLDMENEESGEARAFISEKWLGRRLTEDSFGDATEKMNDLIINSTKDDDAEKNA